MANNDSTVNIPLTNVVSHTPSAAAANGNSYNEKSGLFHRGVRGRRKAKSEDLRGQAIRRVGDDGEEDVVTSMGRIYDKILNFSIITRYFLYVLPLALLIAIPIIVDSVLFAEKPADGQQVPGRTIGGVRIKWFFTWIEIVWLSLWVSKLFAHFLPKLFTFVVGVVSSGTRKYALLLAALEIPLSLVGWAVASLATFIPLMTRNPDTQKAGDFDRAQTPPITPAADEQKNWQTIVQSILAAALASTLVFLVEKTLIQLLSISYHRKQFTVKVKDNKRNVYLLGLLYDASRALFPAYCREFEEEDYIINDSLQLGKKTGHNASGSATPMRILQDVGRFGDKITSAFGHVAQEVTGKKVFDPTSAHSIVVEALERNRSAEALAKRLWMSFVVEGKNSLYMDDVLEVLGVGRQVEAEECFSALDRDGNGDISLDEMILTVTEIGRERKSIASSMHDVDQAVKVLDGLLATVVFVICVFIFVAFLNRNFVTTLATAGTALLSLSFVFAATCQEVLGSCIFLFVKHPYDIGDRIDINTDQLTVEHISLLFTVFKRVTNGKLVQIPNINLNSVWIENVTRSKAMRETISMFFAFDTSFEDIQALKSEMQAFVTDKDNARDFQPEVEVAVVGIAEMNKLECVIEIRHKANWHNVALAAARRSKFMCALVLALRKVPIYGPAGGDPPLGAIGNPSFSVSIPTISEAKEFKEEQAKTKEGKRLNPTKRPDTKASSSDLLAVPSETNAVDVLNARAPGRDPVRDDTWAHRDDTSTLGERPSIDQRDADEVRTLLKRETTRGKRKQGEVASPTGLGRTPSQNPYQSYMQRQPSLQQSPPRPSNDYQGMMPPPAMPGGAPIAPPRAENRPMGPPLPRIPQQPPNEPEEKKYRPYSGA